MSFDLAKYATWDDPQQDAQIADIIDYVTRMFGVTTGTGNSFRMYLNGLDGDTYFEYDDDTNIFSLTVNGTRKARWNVT